MTDATEEVPRIPFKDSAEDTDAIDEVPETIASASMWLRVLGGVIFAVSVGLIIFGLFVQDTVGKELKNAKELKHLKVKAKELTFKPRDEVRTFEFASLPNGMQAVTVQDSRALQKGFAVAVQSGSFDDPVSMPGLAHFCEHMVFLGTDKFKEPSGFDNFVAAHGGFNNALTAEEATVYFASVAQDAAEEGLDRFADFFRAPLFAETYVDKEVHAIDSEHKKNTNNPYRQVLAVFYSMADPASPVSRFHSGNYQTLKTEPASMQPPVKAVDSLKVWFETHYCPDRMKVVTVGSETNAAQLKEIEKQLGTLKPKSRACEAPRWKYNLPNPFPPERLQKWINVQGMSPKSFLWIQFPLPDVSREYISEPLDYIKYVLSYSGENSLARILKDTVGLASAIEVLLDESSASTEVFIVVQLTHQGRNHATLILDVIFAYLAALSRDGVQQDLYNSLAAVEKLKWDWGGQMTPIETSQLIAERMTRVKPMDLLWAESLILKPDRKLVSSLLAKLTPQNMNIAFVRAAPKSQSETDAFFKNQTVKILDRFSIQHTVRDLNETSPGSVEKWDKWLRGEVTATHIEKYITDAIRQGQLKVIPNKVPVPKSPGPIQSVPPSLNLDHMHAADVTYSKELPIDTLLYGPTPVALQLPSDIPNGGGKLWYRTGWMVPSPKVQLFLRLDPLKTPGEPELDALEDLKLELYGRLLSEEMSPKMVDLTAAGMSYTIGVGVGGGGLEFNLVGFAPSMSTIIDKVMSEFNAFNNNPDITPEVRWNRVWHQLLEDLTTYSDIPLNYAVADRNLLLTKGSHHRTELIEALANNLPTLKSSCTSVSDLLLSRPLQLTALAMGNVAKDRALTMVTNFTHTLEYPSAVPKTQPAAEARVEHIRPVLDLKKPVEVRKLNPREGDKNDVVVVSVVAGVSTVESRVLLGILSMLFRAMAYTELRTEQQIGYVVSASVVLLSNVHLMSCVVQGDRIDADAMEAAVHRLSLDLMSKRLADMDDKEFGAYKESFRQELLQPPMAMKNEFSKFLGPINQGGIGFDLLNEMLRFLDGPLANKDALKEGWQKLMFPEQGERKIVAVKYFGSEGAMAPRTLEQAKRTWAEHNVTKEGMQLLEREFNMTETLSKVDSAERKKLAAQGGWFPTLQQLKLKDPEKSASKEPVKVPQQLKDLAKTRQRELETFNNRNAQYGVDDVIGRLSHRHRHGFHKQQKHLRTSTMATG